MKTNENGAPSTAAAVQLRLNVNNSARWTRVFDIVLTRCDDHANLRRY